jgi:hypothetical protein
MVLPIKSLLTASSDWAPTLTVVVDTEEEFGWDKPFDPKAVAVTNIALQSLAQDVMDRYGIVPTYVVDYPVAVTRQSIDVLSEILNSGRCHIGAHLHPWVTPPHEGPIDARTSFPGNLPPELERAKLIRLTEVIEKNFGQRPTIYKAGRYGVGPSTANLLVELGYEFDISVVPHTDFSCEYGPNFSSMPDIPFRIANGLIEIPQSVEFVGALGQFGRYAYSLLNGRVGRYLRLQGVASHTGIVDRLRLTPEGHNEEDLIRQTLAGLDQGKRLFMLCYHSSSLLPGVNPYVRTQEDRRIFLNKLDKYFNFFFKTIGGCTASIPSIGHKLNGYN